LEVFISAALNGGWQVLVMVINKKHKKLATAAYYTDNDSYSLPTSTQNIFKGQYANQTPTELFLLTRWTKKKFGWKIFLEKFFRLFWHKTMQQQLSER